MLKIPFKASRTGYEPPVCETRFLQVQVPVLTSYEIPGITEEDEEDW
jgi:hypothetical protein